MTSFKRNYLALSITAISLSGMPLLLQAENLSVSNNNITIANGETLSQADGARSTTGNTLNNNITINEGAKVSIVFGGNSNRGDSIGNSVIVRGTVDLATGGSSGYYGDGKVSNNSVIIEGGFVSNALGGTNVKNDVTNNSVIINNGAAVAVAGGHSVPGPDDISGNAISNSVTINNGTVVEVIGGIGGGATSNATDNTVTITGATKFLPSGSVTVSGSPLAIDVDSSILGGYNGIYWEEGLAGKGYGDIFSGNTLNFSANPVSVKTIGNFEKYNFTLNPEYANTKTALITADEIQLGYTEDAPAKIEVVGIHAGKALNVADDFVLMHANDKLLGYGEGMTSTGVAQQGIALLYDIETKVDTAGKVVTARVLGNEPAEPVDPQAPPVEQPEISPGTGGSSGGKPAGRINPQLKALSEGYIAGAMLVNRGADTVAFDAFDAIDTQNSTGGLAPFVTLSASRTRYNSGSHVKSNDVVLSSGLSFKQDNITMGAFLETGRGSYDSYNSFSNAAKVHGSGNTRYYGAGLLGRYTFDSQVYTDASVRFGRTRTKFDTSDIQNLVTGDAAKYNLRSNYLSAHIGAGYVLTLNDKNSLDLSAKYLRSTVDGAKADIAGDSIDFDRVNSDRVRANALFSHTYSDTVSFNAGVGYEHEFDSKTKATARTVQGNLSIDAPDVKGGTGIFSLGATVTPNADKNFSLDFNVDAYTGKREGAGASIRAGYAF